jgi:hypothetical protein
MGLTSKFDKLKLNPFSEVEDSHNTETTENLDDIDEVDNEGQSILMSIISQLRPGCDLTKITLPTFILERKSMLERITNFFQIPDILLEANKTDDSLQRFILVLKWYLASFHIAPKAVKKPLNPVLGEIFTCYWDDLPNGEKAYYVSEQTSHHPPKSSYFYLVPNEKIRVDGVVIPRSRFLGNSTAALMEGLGHVILGERDDEIYMMNQPNIYCRGILFGKMKMELGDHIYVKCERTGYEADIEFKTKGFISGSYDVIEGFVKNTKTGERLYNISGKWNEVMEIKDLKTGKSTVLFDTANAVRNFPKVRPLNEQFDYESRKLWKPTIDALGNRDHTTATEEKYKVENEQRERAKKRLEDGVEFHPKLFRPVHKLEIELQDLENVIYKKFDLKDSPDKLTNDILEVVPILPGQKENEMFAIPAFKKHKEQ